LRAAHDWSDPAQSPGRRKQSWPTSYTAYAKIPFAAEPKSIYRISRFKGTWSFAVTPLDQLRLRLTDHDLDRLMQAAKPVPLIVLKTEDQMDRTEKPKKSDMNSRTGRIQGS
jgi:hypothetical protein